MIASNVRLCFCSEAVTCCELHIARNSGNFHSCLGPSDFTARGVILFCCCIAIITHIKTCTHTNTYLNRCSCPYTWGALTYVPVVLSVLWHTHRHTNGHTHTHKLTACLSAWTAETWCCFSTQPCPPHFLFYSGQLTITSPHFYNVDPFCYSHIFTFPPKSFTGNVLLLRELF